MSLKKQLKRIIKNSHERREEKEREEESKLVRSYADWQIVEDYLKNQLQELVARPYSLRKIGLRPGNYVEIDKWKPFGTYFAMDHQRNFLMLSDGSNFEINHKDIQEFCKQHNLKLLYQYKVDGQVTISKKFNKLLTEKYLIKV